jgi:hypothetical protein
MICADFHSGDSSGCTGIGIDAVCILLNHQPKRRRLLYLFGQLLPDSLHNSEGVPALIHGLSSVITQAGYPLNMGRYLSFVYADDVYACILDERFDSLARICLVHEQRETGPGLNER